jgi:sec-independent protein translocase protein TatA
MPSLGGPELLIVLLLALVLFGAGKLGDVGGALGRSIREFRRAANDEEPAKDKRPEEHPEPPRTS